ncbi:hypothetical protein GCM10025864_00660 [Luteimicrobium album]|uniref:Acyl-CoA dehydrogenase/oxidase N-terminal domain-containing protein n=1 Tax=Luteimicrobium album TaxID=1054550 RepID=A0ABQ6HWE7_9MICO|nr:hypothetical protein [Luteimicrobium album]GMA22307.1 hypothetical protein GCM10025864_00660 [Luteimicrobium album]
MSAVVEKPVALDEAAFADLKAELTAWVTGPGEEWSERIEATGDVPPELFAELRERGYLSLAAPSELGGRGSRSRATSSSWRSSPGRTRRSGCSCT